jgi:hypothetical protein
LHSVKLKAESAKLKAFLADRLSIHEHRSTPAPLNTGVIAFPSTKNRQPTFSRETRDSVGEAVNHIKIAQSAISTVYAQNGSCF